MFDAIYYEEAARDYPLGKELLERYGVLEQIPIENHNNIPVMREKENKEFPRMKRSLIIGVRKTHKYVLNEKVSDFLVPYTSSGCTAMCLYCYLVCNFNKCAYLRLFVNREEMFARLQKRADQTGACFEIGSNSDLVLENTITGNLDWTLERFHGPGALTFPTKFHMVDNLLAIKPQGRVVARMSVNPQEVIRRVEYGTSPLAKRIEAVNRLAETGNYELGLLIAPVIFVEGWEALYEELIRTLHDTLSDTARRGLFFEVIFMTYSYVHRRINNDAFPNAPELFDAELMTGRGRGKYAYRQEVREKGERVMRGLLKQYFPQNRVWYEV